MKDFYKSNTFLAIISVISAIIIWIYVVYEVNPLYETWIEDVPVQCVNVSSQFDDGDLVFVGENSKILKEGLKVDVKIKGKRYNVSSVSKKDLTCTLDLITITKKGNYTIAIDVKTDKSGIDIVKVSPAGIELSAEGFEQRDIKVSVKKEGVMEGGYTVANVKNDNEIVKVTGPSSVIDKIKFARAVLDMSKLDSDDTEFVAPIEFFDEAGNKINSDSIQKTVEYAKISFDIYSSKEVTIKIVPKYKDDKTVNNRGETVKLSIEGDDKTSKDGGIEIKVKLNGRNASLKKYSDAVRTVYTEDIDVSKIYENTVLEDILASELTGDVEFDKVPSVKVKVTVEKIYKEEDHNA